MTNFIETLVSALATAEGFFAADPHVSPRRNHNPYNLRAAPWLKNATVKGGFWVAECDAQGIAGAYHQVALDIARGMTLREMCNKNTPPSDNNNTELYIRETARRCGIDADKPMQEYLEIHKIP